MKMHNYYNNLFEFRKCIPQIDYQNKLKTTYNYYRIMDK